MFLKFIRCMPHDTHFYLKLFFISSLNYERNLKIGVVAAGLSVEFISNTRISVELCDCQQDIIYKVLTSMSSNNLYHNKIERGIKITLINKQQITDPPTNPLPDNLVL